MTAYETVMVMLGILGLLISFGGFVIALIAFLDKRKCVKISPPCLRNRMGGAH